jgi:hypothetical protein
VSRPGPFRGSERGVSRARLRGLLVVDRRRVAGPGVSFAASVRRILKAGSNVEEGLIVVQGCRYEFCAVGSYLLLGNDSVIAMQFEAELLRNVDAPGVARHFGGGLVLASAW